MTLLRLKPTHSIAVIEIGIDEPGAMAQHMELVAPTTSVVTRIAEEHLEKLIDLPTVAHEEGIALTWTAEKKGTVIIALDDPWLKPHALTLRTGIKWGFTFRKPNSETSLDQIVTIEVDPQKSSHLTVYPQNSSPFQLESPLSGIHNAHNLSAAVTVALSLGLTPEQIQKGLKSLKAAYGRSEVI
jgi:UDP-N-acetylmuramoyl-tripeptide--D-alanyl-D-alanine ligase